MELKKSVFVVMAFNDSQAESAYTKIVQPLCATLGLNVVRADEIPSTQVIYNDIVRGITEANIIIADISGINPNVMYELGMAHIIKQQCTIMLTHDEVTKSPFDIRHFRIIQYADTIEGSEKLKTELEKTLNLLLSNYKITSRDEFEFCIEFYNSMGKTVELIGLIGLSKLPSGQVIHKGAFWEGVSDRKKMLGSRHSSINGFVRPFEALRLVEIKQETIYFTDKGKAFIELLEEKGYECKTFDLNMDATKPMKQWLDENQPTSPK